MNQPISFGKSLARVSFVIILLVLLSAPQLLSKHPGPIFNIIKTVLVAIPFLGWILIIFFFLAVLWAATNVRKLAGSHTTTSNTIDPLSISDAARPDKGGNGLSSASYVPSLNFLRTLGWLSIKDSDKECIVIDGRHVIRRTRLFFAPMLLVGKPINARRVLLSPPPLEDIKATALTSDQLNLTLVVTVKYSVIDPIYVASLAAPLAELTNLITGVIVERIHAHTLEDIVKDDGTLRQMLKRTLSESVSIKNHFRIDEVLKALPTGDERIIEIIRQTREAIQKQALIDQEGQNRERVATVDLAIKKKEAELEEEFTQRQHRRDMEILHLQQEYEAMRELMRTIAQVAASGVNPGPAIREIRAILSETKPEAVASLPPEVPESLSLFHQEHANLQAVQDKLGYKSFYLQPLAGNADQPGSAVVKFHEYTIQVDCPAEYPAVAPQVVLQPSQGDSAEIAVPWFAGSNLIDAVTAAVMQVRIQKSSKR